MKQRELTKCLRCGEGMMHAGSITFFRVRIERFVVDLDAVRQQHGLELQIGALATHMGPDRDLAVPLGPPAEGLVCEPCVVGQAPELFELWAKASESGEPADASS